MKIKIISVGKLKEKYLKGGIEEYVKRLGRFTKVELIELGDEKIPDNASDAQCEQIKAIEGKKIMEKIKRDEFVFSLCIEGEQMDSEDFAKKLSGITLSGKNVITFVIGGSLGLSDEVKKASDFKISFSKMTFPHQLMKMFLTEQIYRAFKINANEQYHK